MAAMYSAGVLDHFQNPRRVGEIEDATVTVELHNPACGDVLRLSLRIEEHRIIDARFQAKGCVPTIACASSMVERLTGQTLESVRSLTEEKIIQSVGGLPQASSHAAALAIEALRASLKKL